MKEGFLKLSAALTAIILFIGTPSVFSAERQKITALYIPLADHYAAIVAYEKYRNEMQYADFEIIQMKSWPDLRGKFEAGQCDMAFIICPMAMDMFKANPDFRWVSLMHRDGNAMAISDNLNDLVQLKEDRLERKPDSKVADVCDRWKKKTGKSSICAVPSLYATHTAVLYQYLKNHGKILDFGEPNNGIIVAKAVAPPLSPQFLKNEDDRGNIASFEQSLPWADVVETGGFGKVAWYSKDVVIWPLGHVECIVIATDDAIRNKKEAIKEVIEYIHKAGRDIDLAREKGGEELRNIALMINTYHIQGHNTDAIIKSLDWNLSVINYSNLNVDKPGLKQIMDICVEANMIDPINIDTFADESFGTEITKTDESEPAEMTKN